MCEIRTDMIKLNKTIQDNVNMDNEESTQNMTIEKEEIKQEILEDDVKSMDCFSNTEIFSGKIKIMFIYKSFLTSHGPRQVVS